MGAQNFDDHSRLHHTGARDYANNFLEVANPTPLFSLMGIMTPIRCGTPREVEGIRKDVRVVNLSLIAVDWYINLLRRKVNDSPPIKMSIPIDAYQGKKRNQVFYYNPTGQDLAPRPSRILYASSERTIRCPPVGPGD